MATAFTDLCSAVGSRPDCTGDDSANEDPRDGVEAKKYSVVSARQRQGERWLGSVCAAHHRTQLSDASCNSGENTEDQRGCRVLGGVCGGPRLERKRRERDHTGFKEHLTKGLLGLL